MKNRTAVLLAVTACLFTSSTHGAALNTAFTYQGRLNDNGQPANGSYDLTFQLFDAEANGAPVGVAITNTGVAVANGLFATSLDFGEAVFDGSARWLEISAKTNGATAFTALSPRQPLTPTPYAVQSASTAGVRTSTNQAFEVFVSGQRALRIEPSLSAANVISGYPSNSVSPGVSGAAISGGGGLFGPNLISADGATIGGGFGNSVSQRAFYSTICGGDFNSIEFNAPLATIGGGASNTNRSNGATISGGTFNLIETNSTGANIAGGGNNTIRSDGATIGGGYVHTIGRDALNATIAGGWQNTIADFTYGSVIGGGSFNTVLSNTWQSVISGGTGNNVGGTSATVGGGINNAIQSGAYASTIGGGSLNVISSNAQYAFIGGGVENSILNGALNAVVAGGARNTNAGIGAAIGGGTNNFVATGAYGSIIGGGQLNAVRTDARFVTVAGGNRNEIGASTYASTIAGGELNTIRFDTAWWTTIGGGVNNSIYQEESTISGGGFNTVEGRVGVIAGGHENVILTNADHSAIGGGLQNRIQEGAGGSIISGGEFNNVLSNAPLAMIPGGLQNVAGGRGSFAAGYRAQSLHDGCFVWKDSTEPGTIASTGPNQFIVRAAGGVWFGTNNSPSIASDQFINTSTGGYLSSGGAWTDSSDRNAKENFGRIDTQKILAQVAQLQITTWNYKNEKDSVRHIGPVAQDFREAFDVGQDDHHIAAIDANGVALAAIQGLNLKLEEKLSEQQAELETRSERIATLEASVAELKEAIARLRAGRK